MNELTENPIIDLEEAQQSDTLLPQNNNINLLLDKTDILKKRALELSSEQAQSEIKDTLLIVEFMIQDEKFAFDIQYIKQVAKLHDLTPLPCTPAFITGIINFHGRIVTVINLSEVFDLPKSNSNKKQIIILEKHPHIVGILADEIVGIRFLQQNELQPNITTFTHNTNLMRGITMDNTVMLDAVNLMTNEKFIVNEMT